MNVTPRKKSSAELKLANEVTDLLMDNHDLKARISNLEARLILSEAGDESSLAPLLPPVEAEIVMVLEALLIRGLTPSEAYFLGRMVQAYGPQRAKQALDQKRNSKQVIRAAYAMLNAGAKGKAAPTQEVLLPTVKWWEADKDFVAHD